MGGWISLLCAIKRPDRIAALMGIAAGPDFTVRIYDDLPEELKAVDIEILVPELCPQFWFKDLS